MYVKIYSHTVKKYYKAMSTQGVKFRHCINYCTAALLFKKNKTKHFFSVEKSLSWYVLLPVMWSMLVKLRLLLRG